ncbi:hypothetical protein RN001_012710 [Aquatica leii]|uniref:Uncharacterized protein n=1 Tax=Aquatica leii TaxID=1421715 RepID=A0AAN7QFH8_9COLE|nr:hypothetical protein RN001_012710 [Aquatica leii]
MPSTSTVEDNENQVPSDLSLDQNQESSSGIPAMGKNQSKYDNNSVKTQTSFEEIILGIVKRDQVTTKKPKKRVCLGAEVITRIDVTQFQHNTQVTKKIKTKKNIQKKKRDISSDESEVESWKSDVSSDRITEFDDLSESPTDEETNSVVRCTNNANSNPPNRENKESIDSEQDQVLSIQNGDFVLAYFFGKKKNYKYVCLVTEILDDEAEVTCLRKLRNASEYRLDESDKCSILLSDIIEKLPQPKLLPHGNFKKYVFPQSDTKYYNNQQTQLFSDSPTRTLQPQTQISDSNEDIDNISILVQPDLDNQTVLDLPEIISEQNQNNNLIDDDQTIHSNAG